MFLHEEQITCPYCWESITLMVDPSESQTYTEDCFVCCRPILVITEIDGESINVRVTQEDLGFQRLTTLYSLPYASITQLAENHDRIFLINHLRE